MVRGAPGGTVPATGPAADADATAGPGGRRVLVLVGGLPGAGKTRLLGSLLAHAPAGTRGLDSEQVAAALHALGLRLPYRLLRPVVHAVHQVRCAWSCTAVPRWSWTGPRPPC